MYTAAEALARRTLEGVEAEAGADSLRVADALDVLVAALSRGGKAKEPGSRQLAERTLQIRERCLGPDHPDVATSLNNLALLLRATGDYVGARPLYERALAIREKALGPNDLDLAASLNGLALLLQDTGDYAGARPLFERGLAIREKTLGPDHPDVATGLNNLANLLRYAGDYVGARPLLERALTIWEKALGPDHPRVAAGLFNTANLLYETGDYARARPLFERALAIREKALGPNDPDVAASLSGLANLLSDTGDYARARPLYERALAIRERGFGPEHPVVARSLVSLASLSYEVGDYSGARPLFERALAIREKALGPDHPDVATSLNGKAVVLRATGDYAGARPLLERALAIREKALGPDHPDIAGSLVNLASLSWEAGDHAAARPLYERALAIQEKALGPNHPDVAMSLMGMAILLYATHDYAGARPLLERALTIREKALGPDHPDVAGILGNLAGVFHETSDHKAARPLYERALAIREKALGPDHPDVAMSLNGLANLLRDMGEYAGAWPLYERALVIREKALGPDHPNVAAVLLDLAALDEALGRSADGLDAALRAEQLGREHVRLAARVLAERQALQYAAVRTSGLDLALSLLDRLFSSDARRRVFDAVIRSRALVLDEMGTRHHAHSGTRDSALALLADRLVNASTRYANLVVRGPEAAHPERYSKVLDEARREKEDAERALAEKSLVYRKEQAKGRIGLTEVASALPPGSALVSIVGYGRRDSSATHATPSGAHSGNADKDAASAKSEFTPSYLAFVLLAGRPEPTVVPLGAATRIDSLVAQWKGAAGSGVSLQGRSPEQSESTYRTAGDALRRRVWDPVALYVQGVERVFLVPDGSLNLVSLASLPVGKSDYLIEKGPLVHYLSAERDLVPVGAEPPGGQGLLALGGPDFDHVPLPAASASDGQRSRANVVTAAALSRPYRGERSNCEEFRALRFPLLPASIREIRDVAALWTKRSAATGSRSDVMRLTAAGAAEAIFKERAPGRRVLHLATHGFFLEGHCPAAAGNHGRIGGRPAAPKGQPLPVAGESPLLLSGLVLAGANHRDEAAPDQDDGILTAEEIAALDLSGVEWAVLSACETGLGQVRAGEGVFGLRRAFQVGGAKTLIMSLWSVEDESARLWMKKLYEGRLVKSLGTAEAVREASLGVLRERRARGLSTHPFYWGAFVAAGDWR